MEVIRAETCPLCQRRETRRPHCGFDDTADIGDFRRVDLLETLASLHEAGGLATSDPAYRHGLDCLLKTQLSDGSWHVATRSKPIQTYYESGFPHGKDQFISMAASGWATTALALACPGPVKQRPQLEPREAGRN